MRTLRLQEGRCAEKGVRWPSILTRFSRTSRAGAASRSPGAHKRKWYTLVENDKCLVTALLLIPGEVGIRHSHESGELSVHFSDEMRPEVTWNPPGMVHGGVPAPANPVEAAIEGLIDEEAIRGVRQPGVRAVRPRACSKRT